MMTTVTVQQSDYTYNISSLSSARGAGALAMLNQGDAVITGTERLGESQSHYVLTSSVINPDYTEPCDSIAPILPHGIRKLAHLRSALTVLQ